MVKINYELKCTLTEMIRRLWWEQDIILEELVPIKNKPLSREITRIGMLLDLHPSSIARANKQKVNALVGIGLSDRFRHPSVLLDERSVLFVLYQTGIPLLNVDFWQETILTSLIQWLMGTEPLTIIIEKKPPQNAMISFSSPIRLSELLQKLHAIRLFPETSNAIQSNKITKIQTVHLISDDYHIDSRISRPLFQEDRMLLIMLGMREKLMLQANVSHKPLIQLTNKGVFQLIAKIMARKFSSWFPELEIIEVK